MKTLLRFHLPLLAVCLLAPSLALAQAQATTGVIEGTVADESGAVLPGATVTLKNIGTNFERVVTTDADGRFRGLLLPLGPYRVSAQRCLDRLLPALENPYGLNPSGYTERQNYAGWQPKVVLSFPL